ncbi:hypothetical protein HY333_01535 [Candidatus Collierbacteria bacterium]|nr:hypothetical protein [Candidatus Collierbacteria bacterium]
MNQVYPKHIYEPIRQEVANSYLRHELAKYLPSARGNWRADIERWFDQSAELFPVRDYWNAVHGVMMGFKLYNHLLAFITAENTSWSREKISISSLSYTDFGEYIPRRVGNEPVIVTQKQVDGVDKLVVYDGNNRVNQAVKRGETEIEAFASRFTDERREPTNYWLPTSVLMEINYFIKNAWEEKNESVYQAGSTILRAMLADSESGRYEMKERVNPKDSDYKKAILKDLNL